MVDDMPFAAVSPRCRPGVELGELRFFEGDRADVLAAAVLAAAAFALSHRLIHFAAPRPGRRLAGLAGAIPLLPGRAPPVA